MKILSISLFMFIMLAGIALCFDLLQGFDISESIRTFNPLYVMELPELTIMYLLLLVLIINPLVSYLQKRRNRNK